MKFSIITVCYNSEKTIERTIQGVLEQTYDNYEYIIIDGASTDGTLDIVNKYKDSFKDKLKVVSEPDNGIYDAMNKGISMATGDIIGIINSDDFYENDSLEKIVAAYEQDHENPLSIYYGADRALLDGKEYSIGFQNAEFLDNSMISHPSCFVTKETYDTMGAFDTKYSCVADYDMMLRFKHSGKVKFVPVYAVLANFSLGGTCSTDKAYLELLDLKVAYGMRTKTSVDWEKFLGKCSKIFRKILGIFSRK